MSFYSNFGAKMINEEQQKKTEPGIWAQCHDVKMTPTSSSWIMYVKQKVRNSRWGIWWNILVKLMNICLDLYRQGLLWLTDWQDWQVVMRLTALTAVSVTTVRNAWRQDDKVIRVFTPGAVFFQMNYAACWWWWLCKFRPQTIKEVDVATVMSPTGLWTTILKPWVWHFGFHHLSI